MTNAVLFPDIRGVCKKIAPYIVHQWRDVCEEFGVPDEDLDHIEAEAEKSGIRKSELAFHGLVLWFERVGRAANKDKLLRVVQCLGLRRAEGISYVRAQANQCIFRIIITFALYLTFSL